MSDSSHVPVALASGQDASERERERRGKPKRLARHSEARAVIGRACGALVPRAMAGGDRRDACEALQALGAWHTKQRVTIGEQSYDVWGLPLSSHGIDAWRELLAPYSVSVEHSRGTVLDVARGAGTDTRRVKARSAYRELDRERMRQDELDATAAHFDLGQAPRCEVLPTLPTDQRRIWAELVRQYRQWELEERTMRRILEFQAAGFQGAAEQLAEMPLRPKTLSAARKPDRAANVYGITVAAPVPCVRMDMIRGASDTLPDALGYRKGGKQALASDPNRTMEDVELERWLRLAAERPVFASAWQYSQWLMS